MLIVSSHINKNNDMKKIILFLALTAILACQNNSKKSNESEKGTQNDTLNVSKEFSIPKEFSVEFQNIEVNPNSDTSIKLGNKGTVIHIPKNAFIDKSGKLIKQKFTLKYKDYTNSAEMAFSEIPMIYTKNEEQFFFNSSGMFEIEGQLNGEKIEIIKGKSLTIDYHLAKKNSDINFYKLNADSSNWELISEIKPQITTKNKIKITSNTKNNKSTLNRDTLYIADEAILGNDSIRKRNAKIRDTFVMKDDGNRTEGTLLGMGSTDPGHTYPDIIKGLCINSFGVYNCDQICRIPYRIKIKAKFIDKDRIEIKDLKVLSLIDLRYNGAFSFDPTNFVCDSRGKNVLLLFTKSLQLYLFGKGEFEKMKIKVSGDYTFTLENVTSKFKCTKDLAAYLNIKM
jgi:hypothetical protein